VTKPVSVLIVAKGHAFAHDAFLAMFTDMRGVTTTFVEQPAAQVVLQPEHAGAYDTVLFYDMSGIPGIGLQHDGANDTGVPSAAYQRAIEGLLARGTGIVLLNHATVSWPAWPLWRAISGTSFMLKRGVIDGVDVPGSGYRGGHGPLPNAEIRLVPAGRHPVLEGLEDGFEIADELYLKTRGFEQRVVPLLRGDYAFVAENFTPPPLAPPAERAGWNHPPGSDLVVWANAAGASPVVVSDLGDGPQAFANPGFRRLLCNALVWTASREARTWAREFAARSAPLPTSVPAPIDVVRAFIDAWNRRDWDAVVAAFTDDVVYHNIPMEPLVGKAAAGAMIRSMQPTAVDWQLLSIAANGDRVLTERLDTFVMPNGKSLSVPVMGTFEIAGGRIGAWRDYFDLATFTRQMA
jgi:hypothetical protein